MKTICLILILFSISTTAIIYVDNTLDYDCNGNYSIENRDSSGTDGDAYDSVQNAIAQMEVGDTVMMRGGIYQEGHIRIPTSKNGSSWGIDSFNTLMSYPGEWAILDGENNIPTEENSQCVLGYDTWPGAPADYLTFWRFIRFEITNGRNSSNTSAMGFFGSGGPFHFFKCAFTNNYTTANADLNPGAISGHCWRDCIVEYCYFYNNGCATNPTDYNSCHLQVYSDYDVASIAENGFVYDGHHNMRNTVRYCLFVSDTIGAVAIKHKNDQLFTGRNPSGGHGYSEAYNNYGDRIHHNIMKKTRNFALDLRQDFVQVYNNIFDSCYVAATVGEYDVLPPYKAVIYNNTIVGKGRNGINIMNHDYLAFQDSNCIEYCYNNIVDSCTDDDNAADLSIWRPLSWTSAVCTTTIFNRNFFYRPRINFYDGDGTLTFLIGNGEGDRLTVSEFNSRWPSLESYYIDPVSDTLYSSTYITSDHYRIGDGRMIDTLGFTVHPYLSDTLPSYIGATDPNSPNGNKWVADVNGLSALGDSFYVSRNPGANGTIINLDSDSMYFYGDTANLIIWPNYGYKITGAPDSSPDTLRFEVTEDTTISATFTAITYKHGSFTWMFDSTSFSTNLKNFWMFDSNTYDVVGKNQLRRIGTTSTFNDTEFIMDSSTYLRVPSPIELQGQFTLSFKCKLISWSGTFTGDVVCGDTNTTNECILFLRNVGYLRVITRSGNFDINLGSLVLTNYHVYTIVSRNSDSLCLYVDGVYNNIFGTSNALWNDSIVVNAICEGYNGSTRFNMDGSLGWMTYHNASLSAGKIDTLRRNPWYDFVEPDTVVYVVALGQSNMSGRQTDAGYTNPLAWCLLLKDSTMQRLADPWNYLDGVSAGASMGPILGRTLSNGYANSCIIFCNASSGARGIAAGVTTDYWSNTSSPCFTTGMRMADSVPIEPSLMAFWAGETDQKDSIDSLVFYDSLTAFVDTARSHLGNDSLPILFIAPRYPGYSSEPVRGQLYKFCDYTKNCFLVADAYDYRMYGMLNDSVHINKQGQDSIGLRIGNFIINKGDSIIDWPQFSIDSNVVRCSPDSIVFSRFGTVNYNVQISVTINNPAGMYYSISGDTSGMLASFTDIIDENKSYTFTFDTILMPVSLTNNGNGSTSPSSDTTVNYGTPVNLATSANTNYHFCGWTIVSGTGSFNGDSTTFSPTDTSELLASFGIDTFYVGRSPGGGGTMSTTDPDTIYGYGDTAVIIITPNHNYRIFGNLDTFPDTLRWEVTHDSVFYASFEEVPSPTNPGNLFVQSNDSSNLNLLTGTTAMRVALHYPVTLGNSLILDVHSYDSAGNDNECIRDTVTDNLGNDWELIDSVCRDYSSSIGTASRWRVRSSDYGICTCTVTFDDARAYWMVMITEFAGLDTDSLYIDKSHSTDWSIASNQNTDKVYAGRNTLVMSTLVTTNDSIVVSPRYSFTLMNRTWNGSNNMYLVDSIPRTNDSVQISWLNSADADVVWISMTTSFRRMVIPSVNNRKLDNSLKTFGIKNKRWKWNRF